MLDISMVKFDANGLVPAIVQDVFTGKVLMMAYMNQESLEISVQEKKTCFWSRSRQELWRKGATSGNTQQIVSITPDCDGDTLLIQVIKAGPACHNGTESCFTQPLFVDSQSDTAFSLTGLYDLLEGRKINKQEGSYTTYLFEKGLDKILKKVGEEATEVIIAAKNSDNRELVYELADLVYHSLVLMVQQGVTLDELAKELAGRHVVDKKVKQETSKA